MSKKKSYQPQSSPAARVWRGLRPFRGLAFILVGLPLFVWGATVGDNVMQIAALVCLMIGGAFIGAQYRERQQQKKAEQIIRRKIEKKQARKAARRGEVLDEDEQFTPEEDQP